MKIANWQKLQKFLILDIYIPTYKNKFTPSIFIMKL